MEKRLTVYYLNKNIFESGDIISFNRRITLRYLISFLQYYVLCMYIIADLTDLSPEIVRVAFHFIFYLIREYVSKFDVIISNDAITCGRTCM